MQPRTVLVPLAVPLALLLAALPLAAGGRGAPPAQAAHETREAPLDLDLEPYEGPEGPTNAVLGDLGFEAHEGRAPGAGDDQERLRLHLFQVERLLRAADTSHLESAARLRRAVQLDRLHDYAVRGAFPYAERGESGERRPFFVDHEGNHCAVGHLLAMDGHDDLVHEIASSLPFATVDEIAQALRDHAGAGESPLDAWSEQNGLEPLELAMIQPSYGWRPRPEPSRPLTKEELSRALSLHAGPVSACVHDVLPASAEHPRSITAEVEVAPNGTVQQVKLDYSTPVNVAFERCIATRLMGLTFRGWQGAAVKGKHAFPIVGPTLPTGAFDPAYGPVLLGRAAPAIDRCIVDKYPGSSAQTLVLTARVEAPSKLSPQKLELLLRDGTSKPASAALSACVGSALATLALPKVKGAAVDLTRSFAVPVLKQVAVSPGAQSQDVGGPGFGIIGG